MKRFKKINCPLCKEKKYKILYKSTLIRSDFTLDSITKEFKNSLSNYTKHGQIVKCSSCNVVYVNPVENFKLYNNAYEDVVDDEYLKNQKFRKILAQNHLNRLEKLMKRGSILDIGCFAGFFLEIAKQHGWKVYGIEPSRWASEYATKKGIKIIGKDIRKTKIESNFYDAITMWDVIEHLSDPVEAIEKAKRGLKKNGLIAIGTPDADSLLFKILGGHHPYFIRMHLILFSPETLGKLLEQKGFEIQQIYKYGRTYPINYFLDRIETKIKFTKYLRKLTKFKFFDEYPITLNLRDEFTIIARKK